MNFPLLRREWQRTGVATLSVPVLGMAGLLLFMALSLITGYGVTKVTRQLGGGLEMALPLAAAIAAAFAAVGDPCLELQLSLPTGYPRTFARRVLLALVWVVPAGLAGTVYLWLGGDVTTGRDLATAQLAWLAPTLWLVAWAALAGVVFRSAPAAAALAAATWLFEQIQHDTLLHSRWLRQIFLFTTTYAPGSPSWLSDRLWLVTTACVLTAVTTGFLQRPHLLLRGDS